MKARISEDERLDALSMRSGPIDTKFYHDKAEPVFYLSGNRYVRCAQCGVVITSSPNGLCSYCKRRSWMHWNLGNFAKFWQDIEYEEAMKLKAISFYPPCECGSSTCPECNPNGFDGENYDDNDDYESWMDYI